ncbi:MAG: flippase-like domain-containing protein [Anaerolineae bacterium]|nr:flippase-like domain-containing protein [Anaerolineae bacterium]
MNRKQWTNILKIVVSIILLALIFMTIDVGALFATMQNAHPSWLAAALVMMIIGVVIRAIRWQILLNALDVRVPIGELTAIYFIGFLFNNLLPSGLGGDAMRVVELNRHSPRISDTITSVVVDRFLGLFALQAIALVALLTNWGTVPDGVAYFTIAIFLGGLIGGILVINTPLYTSLRRNIGLFRKITDIKFIGNIFESFQRYPLPALGQSFVVAIIFNFIHIIMYAFIGFAFDAPVSVAQYAVIVPITSLLLIVPISFAGLGVREESFRQLYGQIGVSPEVAVAMSLMVYFIGNICTGLIGGVIYLLRGAQNVVSEERGAQNIVSEEQ